MRSEIATIKYVRKYTMVPVPDVLAYDADEDGAVGGEWMIMEFVDGVPLDEVWRGMSNRNRYQVALSIAGCLARLIELRFSHIGSLYEDEGGFRVGAMTFLPSKNVFHTGAPVETQCGPFDSPKDWLLATARRRLEFTSKRELTQAQRARMNQVISDLLSDPALKLCGSSRMSAIALEHVDLGPSNILVDPANPDRVLAIIDWEGARTVPLWAIQPHPFGHLNKEEVSPKQKCALQHIIRHAIASQVPQWLFATGDEGRSFRVLLQMARKGTAPFDEEDFESRDQILRGLKV
ncbi:hypothetical protein OE88DRAFT_1735702 [Heliocybe sulcata]|uniref:Aminoglycoside phosphotransferase domain-containing protein n=1 Tax=Heliocybe sulcata TaxID=5364 RepID=A0A5C3N109_9AGAM|nr:hypothetical protein OE88DRAFT_1735702 [Heliocybe sulcata]